MKKSAVLGIGNILLKDDGIGVRVIQYLQEKGGLPGVELVDGGTCIMDMLGLFLASERIIVVDSLQGGHPPGTIYRLTPEQLGNYASTSFSLHDFQILDLVKLAALLGKTPEVVIIGIEPREITESLELSPEIGAAIPTIINLINQEIYR